MENKTYLFMMLGFLGSGKSFVSRWLAEHVGAVYLRADDLRLRMFGEDRPELYTPENKKLVNQALQYSSQQILQKKVHVIADANHNAYTTRSEVADLARSSGALPIIVWVDTPLETAKRRTEVREVTEGHKLFEPGLVEKMAKRLEEPSKDELVIRLDGLATADEQQASFDKQLRRIVASVNERR